LNAESPCLSVDWHQDAPRLFVCCTDGSVKLFDVETGDSSVVGHHEGPVKSVYWIRDTNALLTLSFDQTLRFWDIRQEGSKHIAGFKMAYKPFCSNLIYPNLAVGLGDNKVFIMNVNDIQREMCGRDPRDLRSDPYLESPLVKRESRELNLAQSSCHVHQME